MSALPLSALQSGPLTGEIRVPGDKSISHRALMLGALADGETMISGLLEGEDVLCTAEAMRQLGARIDKGQDGLWRAFGVGPQGFETPDEPLYMGNSGTSTRLILGLCAGYPLSAVFTGDESLEKRPMNRVIKPLSEMGAEFENAGDGRLPLTLQGRRDLKPLEYQLPVPSAQVKSCLLLAGLNARGRTTIIEDRPTRDHTENMLRHFGVPVHIEELDHRKRAISIEGPATLRPGAVDVPGDPSSAAFPAVAAVLTPGSRLTIENVGMSPTRNGLYLCLQEMGAEIEIQKPENLAGEQVADLSLGYSPDLKGIDVPEDRVPAMIDEFPILAVAAACAKGTTRMTGLAELRVKESDRLQLMAEGLNACGVNLEMGEDSLTIHGTGKAPAGGATVKTALDHRIAMSFLVLGGVTQEPVSIDDSRPIATSFPGFKALMVELGARIEDLTS